MRSGERRLWYDVFVPRGLTCVYSETLEPDPEQDDALPYVRYRAYYGAVDATRKGFYWPGSESKRIEYQAVARRQPRTAAVNYRGDMTGGGEGVFDRGQFRWFMPPSDLSAGIQDPLTHGWLTEIKGVVEEAWDTAFGQAKSTSMTAALTGALVPCREWHRGEDEAVVGKCDFHYDVWLLDLMLESLDFGALVTALRTRYGKWHPRRVNIEEKASGVSLMQTFRNTNIPVRGIKVPQGKLERAINPVLAADGGGKPIPGGAASVQGWWSMGRVLGPAGAEWLERGADGSRESGFLSRVCSFTGGTASAADEFDALVHLVTRAIQMSMRSARMGASDSMPYDGPAFSDAADDSRRRTIGMFGSLDAMAAFAVNPMTGICMAPCLHYGVTGNMEWCSLHGRATTAMSGCDRFAEARKVA